MSDLNGEDAFAKVLSELIDVSYQMRGSDQKNSEAQSRVRDLEADLEKARRAKAHVEHESAMALPKLKELYEAADALAKYASDSASPGMADLSDRVTKALKAARHHCDQEIPF